MLYSLIRSDRHWLFFYFIILASWIVVAYTSTVNRIDTPYQSIYGLDFWKELCDDPDGFEDLFSLWLMWVIMTGAMMFPTLVPTLRTYQDFIYSGFATGGGFIFILLGFSTVWVVYSLLASFLQALFAEFDLLSVKAGAFSNPALSALLLGFAGLYQFSSLKGACVSKCRSPLSFFMQFWGVGFLSSLKMGLRLGLTCLGCCWALMLLALVGGTMSLAFMGLSTLVMVLEKLPRYGDYLTRPLGFALILGATLNILSLGQ